MSQTSITKKKRLRGHSKPSCTPVVKSPLRRWLVLGLCLALAGAAAYGVATEFVFSKLPDELVGKWVVQDGEQEGATFDFFRNGTMIGRLNNRGKEATINARVAVEGDALFITTKNPWGQDDVRRQTIKTLTKTELVLVDGQKTVFRMRRVMP